MRLIACISCTWTNHHSSLLISVRDIRCNISKTGSLETESGCVFLNLFIVCQRGKQVRSKGTQTRCTYIWFACTALSSFSSSTSISIFCYKTLQKVKDRLSNSLNRGGKGLPLLSKTLWFVTWSRPWTGMTHVTTPLDTMACLVTPLDTMPCLFTPLDTMPRVATTLITALPEIIWGQRKPCILHIITFFFFPHPFNIHTPTDISKFIFPQIDYLFCKSEKLLGDR